MNIHNRLVSQDLRELHKRLVELYGRMKKGIGESSVRVCKYVQKVQFKFKLHS